MQYAQWQVVINHDAQTNEQIPKKRKLHFHQHSDRQTDGITCVGVTRGLQVNCLKRLAHVQRSIYRLTAHYKISVHVWHVAQEHVQWSQSILTNRLQCLYFLDICTADWSRHFRLNYHFISLHSSYLNQRSNLLMWGPIQRSETRLTHPIFFALRTFCMQVTMTPDIVLQSTFKTHFASTFYTISGVKKKKLQYFPLHFSGAEVKSGMRRKHCKFYVLKYSTWVNVLSYLLPLPGTEQVSCAT